ncbi:MAG TPA: PadR family transcriptional regulator [Ktedonobacteraceae bacterium]|jgi:DNA-binding PadR family transcriptional regulator
MAKENTSRYAILGMLALKPTSGYGIKKLMEQSTSNFWSESYGQIYPILKQLTREGLATSHTERQEGKPERNIYTLTAQGKTELVNWLGAEVEEMSERIEILLKLFFGQLLPSETNIAHIQRFQGIQQRLLQKYQEIELHLRDGVQTGSLGKVQGFYSLITVRYGIHHCRSLLAWCEETLASLQIFKATSEL